jgi:hypothetical protein
MKRKISGLGLMLCLLGQAAFAADGFTVLRVSTPLIVSGSAGLRFGDDASALRPTLQAEAGVGGGRIAIGFDNTGHSSLGFGLKAALLRTWFEPVEVDEEQNFLGLEAELSIKKLLLNAGGYRRIGDGDDDWLTSVGLGFVF